MLRILYTNARSLIGKIDVLKSYVFDLKPTIVCISEACTNSSISNAYLDLDGYSLVVRADGKDTKNGWCRGLLVYVKLGTKAAQFESKLIESMTECEGVTLPYGKGRSFTIILAYRPPRPPGSEADQGFSDKLCNLLSNITSPAVVLGDLNFAGIDWEHLHASSEAEKRVLETVQNHFWSERRIVACV